MEAEVKSVCGACLSIGRRMIAVDDYLKKQCFISILNEIPMLLPEESLQLCWECDALITRFINFKDQVKCSYGIFYEYLNKNIQLSAIRSNSKLCNHKLKTVSCLEIDTEVKEEQKIDVEIKEELDTFSDHSDDNRLLIDFKKSKVNGKIKKKKKRKELRMYKEVELTEQEIDEERKLATLRDDYVNAMFRCDKCIESFANADDMKDHVYMKHELNATNYKCCICECSFSSEVSFNYHKNKHKRRYQCVLCGTKLGTKRSAVKHYSAAHWLSSNIDIQLITKEQEIYEKTECIEEMDNTKQSEAFPCEVCDKTFRWKTSLRKHFETHRIEAGQKRKPYCEPCRLSFTTSSNLRKHVKTSSKHQIQLKLWKLKESLPETSTSPEREQACIQQIKRSVNKAREQYPCPQCDKRFQWRGNLLRHLHSHEARANGELVCEPCNRTFSSIATYKQHMKISKKHVTENDFKYMCSDCGKRFANKTRLKDHVDWEHLKNYVHTCTVCKKVFKSHTSLYLHRQVVHKNGQAEHLCDHCGKAFPNQAKLRSHARALHSGECWYRCAACPARFAWHSCLSRHVRRAHAGAGGRGGAGGEVPTQEGGGTVIQSYRSSEIK